LVNLAMDQMATEEMVVATDWAMEASHTDTVTIGIGTTMGVLNTDIEGTESPKTFTVMDITETLVLLHRDRQLELVGTDFAIKGLWDIYG
jgi:hypothetical protein